MKRLRAIIGRTGTTLMAISLALLLVSFVPQPQFSQSKQSSHLSPEKFTVAFSQHNLNPQQQLEITTAVDGIVELYLLEVSNPTEFVFSPDDKLNVSAVEESMKEFNKKIQEILDGEPDKIIWEWEVNNGQFRRNYVPTRLINVTVVIFNPSSETVNIDNSVSLKSSLAPTEKTQTIAYVTVPIGLLFTLPWILDSWKQRKNK